VNWALDVSSSGVGVRGRLLSRGRMSGQRQTRGRRSGSDSSRAISRKQSSKLNDADRQFAGSMNSDRRRTDTQTHGQCSSSSLSLSLFLSCNRFIEATRVDREMTNRMRTHFTVICSDRQRFRLKPLCSNRNTSIRYNNNNMTA